MPLLRETLEAFLKDQKADLYASLQEKGEFESFFDELDLEVEDLFIRQMAALRESEPLPKDFMARVRLLNSHKSIATEIVLAEMIEMLSELKRGFAAQHHSNRNLRRLPREDIPLMP